MISRWQQHQCIPKVPVHARHMLLSLECVVYHGLNYTKATMASGALLLGLIRIKSKFNSVSSKLHIESSHLEDHTKKIHNSNSRCCCKENHQRQDEILIFFTHTILESAMLYTFLTSLCCVKCTYSKQARKHMLCKLDSVKC